MATIFTPDVLYTADLRHAADFSQREFGAEMARIHAQTAIEQDWLREGGLPFYPEDVDILNDVGRGELQTVTDGPGYIRIRRLGEWTRAQSDPDHPDHYSPPFLRLGPAFILDVIGDRWQEEVRDDELRLSVTSLVRSAAYQARLGQRDRQVAIDPRTGWRSSHEVGQAFDIDGCGVKFWDDSIGDFRSAHPRVRDLYDQMAPRIARARASLQIVLSDLQTTGLINPVEELPGTDKHCFHIAVHPSLEPEDRRLS